MKIYETAVDGDYVVITCEGEPVDPREVLAELTALRLLKQAAEKVLAAAIYDRMKGWQTDGEPLDAVVNALVALHSAGYLPDAKTHILTASLVNIENKWYMELGGELALMQPQPNMSQLRWNGEFWTVYMGYPMGHDVPIWNPDGLWLQKDTWPQEV